MLELDKIISCIVQKYNLRNEYTQTHFPVIFIELKLLILLKLLLAVLIKNFVGTSVVLNYFTKQFNFFNMYLRACN